jgi:hypothetical protein
MTEDTKGGAAEETKEQDVVTEVEHNVKRLHSAQSSGMESSVLRFKDVNFVIGKGDKQKNILTDVSGTVKWGRTYHFISFCCMQVPLLMYYIFSL